MECRRAGGAAAEEDEGRRMVAFELEAAEALAEMARGGASCFVGLRPQHAVESVVTSQDQSVAAEPTTISSPEKAEKIVEHIPTQLCSTSHPSNLPMKFKRKLTEPEKEERKLRRVMANRESARQTIRRRQAMHLELTRKADDVLEENENLKKQKELMVEEYNSLKGRNDFLKAQLAGVKKVAAGVGETEEERNSPEAERFSSATASTPVFVHNQPSIVPCFWPSILPSSDVFPFQCASHPHNTSSSQFLMPPGDIPCLHQGQNYSMGNPPLFVVPVPWLLPLLTHSSSGGTHAHHCRKCSCSSEANPSDDNMPSSQNTRAEAYNRIEARGADSDGRGGTSGDQCSIGQPPSTMVVPGMFSPVRRRETVEHPKSWQADDSADLRLVSALESMRHGLLRTNQEPIICFPKKTEDVFVATEARKRRKQLMKLKNIHCK